MGIRMAAIRMIAHDGQTFTFIVRFWREQSGPGQFAWRGSLDWVQTGDRVYFQSLPSLFDKIEHLMQTAPGKAPGDEVGVAPE